jgi:hypothetical protein
MEVAGAVLQSGAALAEQTLNRGRKSSRSSEREKRSSAK